MCSATPIAAATRRAAASSISWRWPYANDNAMHSRPSRFAMARTVAESSPPDNKTTAFMRGHRNKWLQAVEQASDLLSFERVWWWPQTYTQDETLATFPRIHFARSR